jgi:hypothetical protein
MTNSAPTLVRLVVYPFLSRGPDKKGYADGGGYPTGDGSCLVGVVPGLGLLGIITDSAAM